MLLNQIWFATELRALGHRVITLGPFPGPFDICVREPAIELNSILERLPEDFSPDRIVYFDNSALPWITGFIRSTIPSLYYSVDTHQHVRWQAPYSAVFDMCLVAQKDYISAFEPFRGSAVWFPPWAEGIVNGPEERTHAAVFRGTLASELNPQRIDFLTAVARLTDLDFSSGDFEEVYRNSKIVLNHCVKGDLNFRIFEAMACGALLISPLTGNGLCELFKDGRDFVSYAADDAADAASKIAYFLEHDRERRRIASSGQAQIAKFHTAEIRAKQLLAHLKLLQLNTERKKFVGAAYGCLASLSVWGEHGKWLPELLDNSADALIASIDADEWDFVESLACVVLCREFFERSGRAKESISFVQNLIKAKPGNAALTLVLLDSLLISHDYAEAYRVACQFTKHPQELLEQVPGIVENLRREALAWFYGKRN